MRMSSASVWVRRSDSDKRSAFAWRPANRRSFRARITTFARTDRGASYECADGQPPLNHERRLERETGIEPATSSLGSSRSTAELLPRLSAGPILPANHFENLIALGGHQLGGDGLEIQTNQRLGVRAAHVEVPIRVVD